MDTALPAALLPPLARFAAAAAHLVAPDVRADLERAGQLGDDGVAELGARLDALALLMRS